MDDQLKALPINDRILKDFHGRVVNSVTKSRFTFGKELQMHVMEIKPNNPFKLPADFEETMQDAVLTLSDFLQQKYNANLLGTGMHPLLKLNHTTIWPHRHRQIYAAYSKLFNLKQHGWLNIQSFQLNLPYANEKEAIMLHNALAEICTYLPAVAASSPIYEGKIGENTDNRLKFYKENQAKVPSVTGDVIPEYTTSFQHYQREIIGKYSSDMASLGADMLILNKEWVNSRGVIFRFDRHAVEIRIMDEQECVKSDVALSCFIRAAVRALLNARTGLLPHNILVKDYSAIVRNGLKAKVQHPHGPTARQVCHYLLEIAWEAATDEEKAYIPLVQKRLKQGNLSETILAHVKGKSKKSDLRDAVTSVYLELVGCLINNEPYF